MPKQSPTTAPCGSQRPTLYFQHYLTLALTLALTACGGGGGSGSSDKTANSSAPANSAPTVSGLSFSPATPKTTDQIAVTATVADSDGDSLDTRYSWSVNDIPVSGADTDSLGPEYFKKGDNVTVTVTASDGTEQTSASLSVTIANSAPTIAELIFSPSTPKTADQITVTATVVDSDGDALDTRYSWSVNESPVPGADTDRLGPEHFEKDDNVTVTVIASDGTDDATASLSVTIADTPPEVTVSGAPDSLAFGTTASFSVDVNDPDNDPFEYRFLARPNGMTIDNRGLVTWHPRSPLFKKETDFHWEIEVTQNDFSIPLSGTIRVVDELRNPPLSRSGVVTPRQEYPDMMIAGDFDGDGSTEILASDGKQRLFTLAFNGSAYEQNWMHPFSITRDVNTILSIHAVRYQDGSPSKFFVGTGYWTSGSEGELIAINEKTREVSQRTEVDGKSVIAIDSADLDNDGEIELAILVEEDSQEQGLHLAILDSKTLTTEWRSPKLGLGQSIAIGQFDNDADPEIALSGGYIYEFFEGEYRNLWAFGAGFGNQLEAGDLDGDGVDELVALSPRNQLRILSPKTKSLLIADETRYTADFIIKDLEPGSGEEILLISDWDTTFQSISLVTQPEHALLVNWSEDAAGGERSNLLLDDLDSDGEQEVAWASGWGEKFYVASLATPSVLEWETAMTTTYDGIFTGGEQITRNDNSKRLLFFAESTDQLGPFGAHRAFQLDPATGSISWSNPIEEGRLLTVNAKVADIDLDGSSEFLYFLGKSLGSYSLASDSISWKPPALLSDGKLLDRGYINEDDYIDFSVITETGLVYTLDALNQTVLDQFDTEMFPLGFSVQDVDDTAGKEFIVASQSEIRVLSGEAGNEGKLLRSMEIASLATSPAQVGTQPDFTDMDIVDLAIGDIDADGRQEIFVAAEIVFDYWILAFNSELELLSYYPVEGELTTLAVQNYGDKNRNLVVALNDDDIGYYADSTLYTLDPITGNEVTRSPELLGTIERGNLFFVDVANDGYIEFSYSTIQGMHTTR
ncbi:hypothetical protein [Biformimicrobium ophioploci]|uniref:Uncharacterized protein n=1 Tax=Biformimicrobium ophioploci TaxID=3036711 RepID=A0ABQ6LWX4_9GAMM|nr:hypothetical protein [Microbulbifer sp. NKW57]GMG86573.1 hypothetical protein MNKW57_08940 [Microbulbifer sp. NKW57]